MAAARDHIVAQLDAQDCRWPCFYRVKKRNIQDRLCFGLAVEAQQQGEFLLLDNDEDAPAGLTRTPIPSTPSPATATAPNTTVDSALDSALDPALPSIDPALIDPGLASIDPALLILSSNSNNNSSSESSSISDLLVRLTQLVTAAAQITNQSAPAAVSSNDQEEHATKKVKVNPRAETLQDHRAFIADALPYTGEYGKRACAQLNIGAVTLRIAFCYHAIR